jgi:hypothetical protein
MNIIYIGNSVVREGDEKELKTFFYKIRKASDSVHLTTTDHVAVHIQCIKPNSLSDTHIIIIRT